MDKSIIPSLPERERPSPKPSNFGAKPHLVPYGERAFSQKQGMMSEKSLRPQERNFFSEFLSRPEAADKPEVLPKKEVAQKSKEPQETARSKGEKMKIKEYMDAIKKYDSNVHLNREQRFDLAERADTGKRFVEIKDVKKADDKLRSEYSRAASFQDRARIGQQRKSLKNILDEFFKKK